MNSLKDTLAALNSDEDAMSMVEDLMSSGMKPKAIVNSVAEWLDSVHDFNEKPGGALGALLEKADGPAIRMALWALVLQIKARKA
jgi:hypothetical protein